MNGYRQEGFAAVRPQHPSGPPPQRGARVPPPGDEPAEPRGALPRVRRTASCFEGTRAVGVEVAGRSGPSGSTRGEVILCGGAINSPQLLQLSGVGNAAELAGARRRRHRTSCPGVGEHLQDHLEVYIQYASTQPVSMRPGDEVAQAALGRVQVAVLPLGPRRRRTTSRRAASSAANDDVAYPNLMFHFLPARDPLRRLLARAADHGYQVHVGPMYSDARGSVKITSQDPRVHPALRFNYLSTEQDRREWVEAVRTSARHPARSPRFDPFNAGEISPGPSVETDEEILDWVRARRRDRAAPLVHVPDGRGRDVGARPGHDARARARRPARRRRLGVPLRHEREHLRARR